MANIMANTSMNIVAYCTSFLWLLLSAASSRNLLPIRDKGSSNDTGICISMVEIYGYICEEHTVTTEDGYILGMQRIPSAQSGQPATKPPVLLQHGLLIDAGAWLLNSPTESLGFVLADNGYDVWLANTRGTRQSRRHTSLFPNDPAYWDWSWDELVKYDLVAFVQHIQTQTGQNLHYVGHSLGPLLALAAISKHEMLNMLRSVILLSPVIEMNHISSPIIKVAANIFLAEEIYWLGLHEFLPGEEAVNKFLNKLCSSPGINCSSLMTAFTGSNCCVNTSKASPFFEHEPEPTSTKNMIHLFQVFRTGRIAMYDYGSTAGNMEHYNQPTPPEYNVTDIPKDLPLFIGYGGQDQLADAQDVQSFVHSLKGHELDKLVVQYVDNFAHVDFVLGVTASQVIYPSIMAFFKLQDL